MTTARRTGQPPGHLSSPIPNLALFDDTLPAAALRSYCRLYAYAWRWHETHPDSLCTPPLEFESELLPILAISRTQAWEHLKMLRVAKLISWSSNGASRFSITFPMPSPENRTLEVKPPQAPGVSPENRTHESGKPDSESGKPDSRSEAPQAAQLESGKPDSRRLEEESILRLWEKNIPSPVDPSVSNMLDATRILFGEPILGPAAAYQDTGLLLAAIAEAYDNRHRMNHPARVVYSNMRKNPPPIPAERYCTNPFQFLPREFLTAAGLVSPQPAGQEELEPEPEQVMPPSQDDTPANGSEPKLEAALPAAASLDAITPSGRSAAYSWRAAVSTLLSEMPRSTWHFIESCQLIDYQPDGTFIVRAESDYAAAWVLERLTRTLTRTLSGIANQSVDIQVIT